MVHLQELAQTSAVEPSLALIVSQHISTSAIYISYTIAIWYKMQGHICDLKSQSFSRLYIVHDTLQSSYCNGGMLWIHVQH